MSKKVSVIGIGRLGLSFALLLDSKGYDVMGCDVNERYIDSLNGRTFSSNEPHINELLKESTIQFTTKPIHAFNHCNVIFVFVPTPSKDEGDYDHQYVDQVVAKIITSGIKDKLLIIGCTVMPNYCKSIQEKLSRLNILVVYNPAFIAQGSIVYGLKNADIVLIGGDNITESPIINIYRTVMDKEPVFKLLSLTGAEIAKISLNCFLTTKISFANRIAEICISSGIEDEVYKVLNTIGSDHRVGNEFLRFGYGFSGVCLPRDNRALGVHAKSVGVSSQFQEMIDETNNQHLDYLRNYFINSNPNKDVPFVFYQLSYKKGVDIITESQPLKLCLLLLEEGYKVVVVESKSVIDQLKAVFKKYENNVSYDGTENGFVIHL